MRHGVILCLGSMALVFKVAAQTAVDVARPEERQKAQQAVVKEQEKRAKQSGIIEFRGEQAFKEKELQKDKEIAALEKLSGKDVQKDKQEKEKHEKEKHEKNEPKEKQEKEQTQTREQPKQSRATQPQQSQSRQSKEPSVQPQQSQAQQSQDRPVQAQQSKGHQPQDRQHPAAPDRIHIAR